MPKKKIRTDEGEALSVVGAGRSEKTRRAATQIFHKLTTKVYESWFHMQTFEKFLRACHLCLDDLPHLLHTALTDKKLINTDEQLAAWKKEFEGVRPETITIFAECFALLLDASEDHSGLTYEDVLGPIYMEMIGKAKWNNDKFYTPSSVATAMAMMSLSDADIVREFFTRLSSAADEDPLLDAVWKAFLMTAMACAGNDEAEIEEKPQLNWLMTFLARVWPLAKDRIKPYTIMDPCVGSGGLLLAAAKQVPRWLIDIGFVQFFGTDIDHTAVEMCRLNMRLYGIEKLKIEPADALKMAELMSLPEFWENAYKRYQQAAITGDQKTRRKIESEVEAARPDAQLSLFSEPIEAQPRTPQTASKAQTRERKREDKQSAEASLFDLPRASGE